MVSPLFLTALSTGPRISLMLGWERNDRNSQNICNFKALRHFPLFTGQIHVNFWFSSPQREEWPQFSR